VWADEPKLPPDELNALHAAMMDGLPFGWLTETTGFAVQDEQAPTHDLTDRQLLGIAATAELTADGIDDAARAKRRATDIAADELRKFLPTPPPQAMRVNPDLDAVFA